MKTFLFRYAVLLVAIAATLAFVTPQERIVLDAAAPAQPFPHFWEETFGSGRAILSLRDSYRQDLVQVKQATQFDSVRFHGILMDEVGVYSPAAAVTGKGAVPVSHAGAESPYNFSYVDEIYDGLLDRGVRPFVELSFMPRGLAADPNLTQSFFYRPIVSPPKDYAKWDPMITALARHLLDRYGVDEVARWHFEVWNEPDLDFWGGSPRESTYWQLYDHTARALKAASPRIVVGGPVTAQAAWVPAFIRHVHDNGVPVDFVSTHVYANDQAEEVFRTHEHISREQMVCRAVQKVHNEVAASPMPGLPLIFSEYGASYMNEPAVSDTAYMGPWLASTVQQCDGLLQNLAYWTFSDVFEEVGVVRTPFYGGFGLIAADHIPKPSFNAFILLHKLGTERFAVNSTAALATRDTRGTLTVALWNYAPPLPAHDLVNGARALSGAARIFDLNVQHVPPHASATVWRVDPAHGNAIAAFDQMGQPGGSLTPGQVATLQAAAQLAAPIRVPLDGGHLRLSVPAYGLFVVQIAPADR